MAIQDVNGSQFDSSVLVDVINNDARRHKAFNLAMTLLSAGMTSAAAYAARENAAWHNDEEAEDHTAYHAPSIVQFPLSVRHDAIRELVNYWLVENAIQASEAAKQV